MDLTPSQIARLEKLLQAGFRLVQLERFERHFGVERGGFVALVDPEGGELKPFGQTGYRLGDGIGMLVERRAGKAFVWRDQAIDATPELLETYERFRADMETLFGDV
ncbi:MAG TPA: hypothetical protein VL523_17165 [Terriglobia bacterium]|nr:hypothetical protein [Terriglobia bacterium]